MTYCAQTPGRELVLNPTSQWDGKDKSYKFQISGKSDSEMAKDQDTRKSVGGHVVYLNCAPVTLTSRSQRIVAISVTEAELIQGCECAQDMLFVYHLLREMDLQVDLPMILQMDNQGAIDITNNWSSTGRTRHIDVRYKFLRELKEANLLNCVWCSTDDNETDTFTKNLQGPLFDKHNSKYVGHDAYMDSTPEASKGEGAVRKGF